METRMVHALSLVAFVSGEAYACPSEDMPARTADSATVDAVAATHCARSAALVGDNCAYTTGMVARRVVEEGQDWAWRGQLAPTANDLASQVASPFSAAGARVVANELLELIVDGGHDKGRLALTGKALDIDGVRYVVVTSFEVINS